MKNGKNGHARPFGFLSRFFTDEELRLHEHLERLQRVPADLREIRLAVERGELCAEDLNFDPDEDSPVDETGAPSEER
jgi:hypothetical protein